jgi:hypothetical protein
MRIDALLTVTSCGVGACAHHSACEDETSTPNRCPAGSRQSLP